MSIKLTFAAYKLIYPSFVKFSWYEYEGFFQQKVC